MYISIASMHMCIYMYMTIYLGRKETFLENNILIISIYKYKLI